MNLRASFPTFLNSSWDYFGLRLEVTATFLTLGLIVAAIRIAGCGDDAERPSP